MLRKRFSVMLAAAFMTVMSLFASAPALAADETRGTWIIQKAPGSATAPDLGTAQAGAIVKALKVRAGSSWLIAASPRYWPLADQLREEFRLRGATLEVLRSGSGEDIKYARLKSRSGA